MKLDYKTIQNLKKPGRYTDSFAKGLHIWVKPTEHKYWVFRYTFKGKQKNISFGPFPLVSLLEARKKALDARQRLHKGIDPIEERIKSQAPTKAELRFSEFAVEYIETKKSGWSNEKHARQWMSTITQYAEPVIGKMSLNEISTEDILKILNPIWSTKTETASRLRGRLEKIFAAAITRGYREKNNPALWIGHLETILPPPKKIRKVNHHKALAFRELPKFVSELREICTIGSLALEFTILNASRTGEVLGAKKCEVKHGMWVIPSNRMKARREHIVPLCQRSMDILAIASAMDPESAYLFSRKRKPLSNMSMAMILRRMNLDITVHGFRSTFRDWVAEETDFSSEVAEMALAHQIVNRVEAAYRRGNLIEKRRHLMLAWEAYCSGGDKEDVLHLKLAA